MKTQIVAHRGYVEKYPENTIEAFNQAAILGADIIELDVHLTKDNKLIVHHDYKLGNPDNGDGFIFNKESSYIQNLSISKTKEKIPFLNEVFEKIGNKLGYEIELKGLSTEFVDMVIMLSESFRLLNKIEFTSPHSYLLSYIKQKNPNIKVGMFIDAFPKWMDLTLGHKIIKANATFGKINVLHCPIDTLTKEFVKDLQTNGFVVHAANCNTREDIEKALKLQVNQLSTDKLTLALKLRNFNAKN